MLSRAPRSVGRLLGELVRTAVDRGVAGRQELTLGVENLQRPLRGRPGVEVHQRFVVPDGARQDREIRTHCGDVEAGGPGPDGVCGESHECSFHRPGVVHRVSGSRPPR